MAANERLTALAGALLLVLLTVELLSAANMRVLLSVHVLVGVVLAGPLAVKIASTGYRLLRYYAGSSAYVRKGPPRPALRVLAVPLVIMTLVVVGSGIGLLVTGPTQTAVFVHGISVLIWLPMIAIHTIAHIHRVPRLIAEDWTERPIGQIAGRGARLGVSLGSLMLGGVAALLLQPVPASLVAWSKTNGNGPPGPLIAGMLVATLALLATRPLRWREAPNG